LYKGEDFLNSNRVFYNKIKKINIILMKKILQKINKFQYKRLMVGFLVSFLLVSSFLYSPVSLNSRMSESSISELIVKTAYAAQDKGTTKKLAPVSFKLQVDIPGAKLSDKVTGTLLANYIKAWYKFAIATAGILATVMIMAGGLIWLTAGGNASGISRAKDWISNAVIGLVLALLSYTLLEILNPSLVTLQSITPDFITGIEFKQASDSEEQKQEEVNKKVGAWCCSSVDGGQRPDSGKCPSGYTSCNEGERCRPTGQPAPMKYSCTKAKSRICCYKQGKEIVSPNESCPNKPARGGSGIRCDAGKDCLPKRNNAREYECRFP